MGKIAFEGGVAGRLGGIAKILMGMGRQPDVWKLH